MTVPRLDGDSPARPEPRYGTTTAITPRPVAARSQRRWAPAFGIPARVTASVRRSRVQQNAVASLVGRGYSAVLSFAFIPVYLRFLGVEAYGLVGFFATLQSMFAILDMGMSTTLSRELARLSAVEESAPEQRDLLRTLELLYWGSAAAIGLLVLLLAPLLAHKWITAQQLPTSSVQHAIMMMGLVIALQFPFTLYQGGFVGLQRHVVLNTIVVIGATLRFAGAVPVLMVRPSVTAFFAWQLLASTFQTGAGAVVLWRHVPRAATQRFRAALLKRVWRFAAGMTGISITVAVLVQMDKVILSRMLPLDRFGYYALAAALAGGLYMVITPIFNAVFPRLSQFIAAGSSDALRDFYHRACQAMSIILLPLALMLAAFPREAVLAWTGSLDVAAHTVWLVRLLAIGTALNGLMTIPYALQLASGWTRLTLFGNAIAIVVLIPSIILLTKHFGAPGAASVWVALNAGYVLVSLQLMHRRLLPGELFAWYWQDVGRPLLGASAVVLLARGAIPEFLLTGRAALPILVLVGMATMAAAGVASPVWSTVRLRRPC